MTCKFVKRGQPRPLFLYFLFYSTTILQKNVRLRHDSNSKPWNWRQARCPHDHHTFLKKTNLTNQVWGIFLNGLGNKFSYNTKLNIWWLLGLFYAKTDLKTFGNFGLFNIPTSRTNSATLNLSSNAFNTFDKQIAVSNDLPT